MKNFVFILGEQFKDEVNVRNFVFIVGDNLRMKLM